MTKGLVTVVVPVYKVEKYLDHCVNSIVSQSYENLEIILVDDGSPDRCPEMCDRWAERDSRIKVFHQENRGLSAARNVGIANATGQYICFVDSDDFIDVDMVRRTYELAEKEQAELVVFGMGHASEDGQVIGKDMPTPQEKTYRGCAVQDVFFPEIVSHNPETGKSFNVILSACVVLFSMELIRRTNWFFVSEREIISEDSFSLLELFSFVRSVAILEEALYYHCENAASLTQVYREDRQEKNMHFYHAALELICTLGYSAAVKSPVSCLFINLTISAMKRIVTAEYRLKEKIRLLKDIVTNETVQYALHDISKRKYSLVRRLFLRAMSLKCTFICFVMLCIKK